MLYRYDRFNKLKNANTGLKTLLGVGGGWAETADAFSAMASTAENRNDFINTTIDSLRSWNFDGLDLNWLYPTATGDRDNFATLMQVSCCLVHACLL
jgi:chitinase